jgi:hypothetical protein
MVDRFGCVLSEAEFFLTMSLAFFETVLNAMHSKFVRREYEDTNS